MRGIARLVEDLLASEEGLCSVELFSWLVRVYICIHIYICVYLYLYVVLI